MSYQTNSRRMLMSLSAPTQRVPCFRHSRRMTAALQRQRVELVRDTAPDALKLNPEAAQALADTLPFLLCGEESAVHAFGSSLMRPTAVPERGTLHEIAQDEARHAQWLGLLAARLPSPEHQLDQHHVQRFFRSMLTRDHGLHFARVAALDLAVCSLLHGITKPGSALKQDAWVMRLLKRILQDEGKHVRLARSMAASLGISALQQRMVDKEVALSLGKLLRPVSPALNTLYNNAYVA
jgi:hypothetical protein